MTENNDALLRLRAEIDAIDQEVLTLINARAKKAQAIGALKQGAIYRPEREAQVLRAVRESNPGPLAGETIAFLFREIMSACLALEQAVTVAYLGPAGTYSEQAVVRQFGHAASLSPFASLEEVFHQVESGHCRYAVVPLENSLGGSVSATLDLLLSTPLKICAELHLRIRHQLMARADIPLKEIRRVYSHAQSLTQCQRWLGLHLADIEKIPVASNAEAAQRALDDPTGVAIAGQIAAERYGLKILAPDIEDSTDNTTRFVVLGTQDVGPSGRDKTSLVLSTANKPGAIHQVLEPLARFGVSMSRLESRPSRMGLWDYVFFVDIEGHAQDPTVKEALEAMAREASFLKVLGAYPVAPL